ncbi:MAG: glycoside hydrolase family 32 protein [Clostridiales bacterium]|jgi:beta-fructofuranosidase|nr:glycoside hydrolase family 32 protein [Clostridiales bacterium]
MERPIFHLLPETGWVNDPNGPVFLNGTLHMFYQHNPFGAVWGNMTWGHAASPDLVRWRRLPHALRPDMPYDKDGVFSGCCVVRDGLPHILYTGVYPETVNLAVGGPDGMGFAKYAGNPVLTGRPGLRGWRDPFVWEEGGGYKMLIGSGDEDGGFVECYEGGLLNWTALGRVTDAKSLGLPDTMWECPVLMRGNEGLAALFVSALPGFAARVLTGALRGGCLEVRGVAPADLGDCLYAPNIVRHPDGRWLMFAWQRELGDESARAAQGWQGMIALPRELYFQDDLLCARPAAEVNTLRAGAPEDISRPGTHYELDAALRINGGAAVFEILRRENGECVTLRFDGSGIAIDKGAFSGGGPRVLMANTRPAAAGSRLRVFLDGTSLEIFVNDRETLTTRVYPQDGCDGFRARAECGCAFDGTALYAMGNAYYTHEC